MSFDLYQFGTMEITHFRKIRTDAGKSARLTFINVNHKNLKSSMSKNKKGPSSMNITGKNVVGSIKASDHAKVDVNQSSIHNTEDANFERLFELLEEKIKARPEDPNVDKEEIREQVNQIKAEAAKGEQANSNKLERWTRNLYGMAPDIADVMASSGKNLSGLTAAAGAKAGSGNKGGDT